MKILIFSGTTEGRKLSGMLSDSGISHTVSVASTYGSDVMPESRFALLKVGRMDEKEMEEYFDNSGFGEGDIVVDATHPYAAAVSENIGKAVKKAGCRLYRIVRSADESIKGDPSGDIRFYDSMEDFAKRMDDSKGSILLTTGSNTLGTYCKNVSPETLARTYVRILPATESIEICRGLGIEPSHVIAMQGPFSYELNRAILDQYEIKHMLTKDSGAAGGYPEKIKAAIDSGVLCHVLSRPGNTSAEDEGYDISYVYEMITGYPYKPKRKIVLAGIGPGRSGLLTGDVREAVSRADAVFGRPYDRRLSRRSVVLLLAAGCHEAGAQPFRRHLGVVRPSRHGGQLDLRLREQASSRNRLRTHGDREHVDDQGLGDQKHPDELGCCARRREDEPDRAPEGEPYPVHYTRQ